MEYAKHLLDECGIGGERLEMFEIAASDAPKFVAVVNEMTDRAKALGPSPLNPQFRPEAVIWAKQQPMEQHELAVQP